MYTLIIGMHTGFNYLGRVLTPFANPARVDDLELKHWIKAEEVDNQGTAGWVAKDARY